MLTFFCKLTLHTRLTFLHSKSSTMSPPVLNRSPNPKANPPTTPCIKPTKQIVEVITNVIILVMSVNVPHNYGSISLVLVSNVILLRERIKTWFRFIHRCDNLLGKSRDD
jgi:hypothetical protein